MISHHMEIVLRFLEEIIQPWDWMGIKTMWTQHLGTNLDLISQFMTIWGGVTPNVQESLSIQELPLK